jgi:hypothetical protein
VSLTRISNEYTAPEVAESNPKWTPAADVFALGATLRSLLALNSAEQSAIRELLDSMTSQAPGSRLEAGELVEAFDSLRAQYLMHEQQKRFFEQVDQMIAVDRERKWYIPVVDKFKPTFRMLTLGLHADVFDVCTELADFINQVLEAYPVRRGGARLKLGYIKLANEETGDRFQGHAGIEALHQLRNSLSHGDVSKSKAMVLRKLGRPDEQRLRTWVVEGAEAVAEVLGTRSLTIVVSSILQHHLA